LATYSLFGVGVSVEADSPTTLALVVAFCSTAAVPEGAPYVRIVLQSGGEAVPDAPPHVLDGRLSFSEHGIALTADGPGRFGCCIFPGSMSVDDQAAAADMVHTLVLFLVAQAGRTPVHASAVMIGEAAIVLAGRSGSGKSTLALAADQVGLPILSDDTVYVEIDRGLWALPRAIHVFEKDAPPDISGTMRYRGGRWKRALPITAVRSMAEMSVLCILEHGETAALSPLPVDDAVAHLTATLEPGYDFYGARMDQALRSLARGGCWRLTLSRDPKEALALLQDRFMPASFHRRYTKLVSDIEARFPVADWRLRDVPVWPLARFDLYLDMHRAVFGGLAQARRSRLHQLIAASLRVWINRWRSWAGRWQQINRPQPAYAVLLSDGVSVDCVDGVFRDRFGEPILTELERQGKSSLLLQSGDLRRFPGYRASIAASTIAAQGVLAASFNRKKAHLPALDAVAAYVAQQAIAAPSLRRRQLTERARLVDATANVFERLLDRVRPTLAFVVNCAAGLGPAFVLACRRSGVHSIDVQRAPYAGAPMAYCWERLPAEGYATMPDVFWSWCAQEERHLPRSAIHRSLIGGHTQLAALDNTDSAENQSWNDLFRSLAGNLREREIIVALQPLAPNDACWERLANVIEAAPDTWRWWIRRHPAMLPEQDAACGRLLSLRRSNVVINPPLPLPVLLRHAQALVAYASGAVAEAGYLGVPTYFLSSEAAGPFQDWIASGHAKIVRPEDLLTIIALTTAQAPRTATPPSLHASLARLDHWARHGASTLSGSLP